MNPSSNHLRCQVGYQSNEVAWLLLIHIRLSAVKNEVASCPENKLNSCCDLCSDCNCLCRYELFEVRFIFLQWISWQVLQWQMREDRWNDLKWECWTNVFDLSQWYWCRLCWWIGLFQVKLSRCSHNHQLLLVLHHFSLYVHRLLMKPRITCG